MCCLVRIMHHKHTEFNLPVQVERSGLEEVCRVKDELLAAKESEMPEKDRGLISLQQRCGSLQTQLETVQRRNQSLEVSGFSC